MSQYTAAVPDDGQVKPEIRSFFEEFYKRSDTPGDHERYAQSFAKSGKLIMGPNEANGRDGMSAGLQPPSRGSTGHRPIYWSQFGLMRLQK
jgi:hypothetical protein